jgi:peptide deformylase
LAIRPILELPNPVLRQRAKKIRSIDSQLMRLAYDMVDTMQHANGVGLAANQVGELKRLIVIQLPDEEEVRIYFNPEIVKREGKREVEEGCLSIPGYRAMINRSVWVRFRAMDHSEKVIKFKAEDILSQALEHEVDHLNGILYIDHMEEHQQLIPVDKSEDDEESAEIDSNDGDADQPDSSGSSVLWTPDDPRETTASLKIK